MLPFCFNFRRDTKSTLFNQWIRVTGEVVCFLPGFAAIRNIVNVVHKSARTISYKMCVCFFLKSIYSSEGDIYALRN